MLIKTLRGWERPQSQSTTEALFRNRRALVKALAAGPILATVPLALPGCDAAPNVAAKPPEADPSAHLTLYPATNAIPWTGLSHLRRSPLATTIITSLGPPSR